MNPIQTGNQFGLEGIEQIVYTASTRNHNVTIAVPDQEAPSVAFLPWNKRAITVQF
jgi:hypothetical protein